MSLYVSVFAGSDNQAKIKALTNGTPIDLSDVTRITLTIGNTVIDSSTTPDAFEWLNTEKTGEIWLKLGPYVLDLPRSCQPTPARITLYDILTPNGYVLDESCTSPSLYISIC